MTDFLSRISTFWQPHAGQRGFLEASGRLKVLACGRRWGKTSACAALVARALCGEVPAKVLIVAPTLDQARILFDRVLEFAGKLFGSEVVAKYSPYPRLEFGGHEVVARSGHSPRSLRGHEATHIIVDEAAFVPGSLVPDTLLPMLATTGGEMTLISTPNGFNGFWRMFEFAKRRLGRGGGTEDGRGGGGGFSGGGA